MKRLAAVAGVVVVIVVVAFYVVTWWGDTETSLALSGTGSACMIVTQTEQKDVKVKRKKKVTWKITNACDTDQTVMLGNFRTVQTSARMTCTEATENAEWPFKTQDQDPNQRSKTVNKGTPTNPTRGEIVLKDAKDTSIQLDYFFDICLGGVKKDPRLVIEP
jgi:hypothetical protein